MSRIRGNSNWESTVWIAESLLTVTLGMIFVGQFIVRSVIGLAWHWAPTALAFLGMLMLVMVAYELLRIRAFRSKF